MLTVPSTCLTADLAMLQSCGPPKRTSTGQRRDARGLPCGPCSSTLQACATARARLAKANGLPTTCAPRTSWSAPLSSSSGGARRRGSQSGWPPLPCGSEGASASPRPRSQPADNQTGKALAARFHAARQCHQQLIRRKRIVVVPVGGWLTMQATCGRGVGCVWGWGQLPFSRRCGLCQCKLVHCSDQPRLTNRSSR